MNYNRSTILAEMGYEFDDDQHDLLDRRERERLRQIDRDEHIQELRRLLLERRKKHKKDGQIQ